MRTLPTGIENAYGRHLENPFLVLAVGPRATLTEIERQAQKWMSMLAAGLDQARHYTTPFGPAQRTAELVRWAVAELRDPARRLKHEWWAEGWRAAEVLA
jgi:hypothetical protein